MIRKFTILFEVFTNHLLGENTCFTNHIESTEHKIVVLKPAIKYQIIWKCHNFKNILIEDFQHHLFEWKFCKHQFLWSRKWKIAKTRQLAIQICIHYLIYSGARQVFCKNYVTLVTLVWSIIFSVSNQPDFNWNTKNIKFRLTSGNHTHCNLKILFHVTHSEYYLGNIWISGIFRKYVPFLSWTFFANIKFMNYTFL